MTLPSNYTDDNEYSRSVESEKTDHVYPVKWNENKYRNNLEHKKSEKGLIGIVIIMFILIISASSYNNRIGFFVAMIFGFILIGIGRYSNDGRIEGLLYLAAFIGFCIPVAMLWHEHAVWMDGFKSRYNH